MLGPEDSGPAEKWLALISEALNTNNCDHEGIQKPRPSFSEFYSLEDELDNGENSGTSDERRYRLAASKQMVGIFLCVWVRADLYNNVSNIKLSCVGRGIMGYLGNKVRYSNLLSLIY